VCRTASGSARVAQVGQGDLGNARGVVGGRACRVHVALLGQPSGEARVERDDVDARDARLPALRVALDQQEPRPAVVDTQCDGVGSEQREQRHRHRAALHRAEERPVERERRLEHDRHALAGGDALGLEQVGEA